MNERIQELAEQAGVTGYFAVGTKLATPIPLSAEMQKFAELIVRECVDIADEYDGVGSTIVSKIKKHFGVEE